MTKQYRWQASPRTLVSPNAAVRKASGGTTVTVGLPVNQLPTDRLALDQINKGFDRPRCGEAIRQVIVMNP